MCEHNFREQLELDISGLKEDLVLQPTQIIRETGIFEENLKSTYVKKTHPPPTPTPKEKKAKEK